MAILLSDYLEVSDKEFEKEGVFNSVIGVDTNLFLDPHLLKLAKIPEFINSREKIKTYYSDIMALLGARTLRADHEAQKRLTFKEVKGVFIGYSVHTGDGKGIGHVLAERLLGSAKSIFDMGVLNPEIFELIGLFEEGFGADRLSDMTIAVIRDDIYAYTQNVVNKFKIKKIVEVEYKDQIFLLPRDPYKNRPLLLLPKRLLRDLPVALSRDGIAYVVAVNEELRLRLNKMIGEAWKNKISKGDIRKLILTDKDKFETLIEYYDKTVARHYDFENDPKGEVVWYEIGKKFAEKNPLTLKLEEYSIEGLKKVVRRIIEQYKKNIESNGLNEHLYTKENGKLKPRPERFAQLLFYSTADGYCNYNNLDISREPNAGNGPVDFKFSKGYNARVLVEIKLSSNPNLFHGFEKQLPAYEESESTKESFYLIVKNTKSDSNINLLKEYREQEIRNKKRIPEIIVVDGWIKPSASKR